MIDSKDNDILGMCVSHTKQLLLLPVKTCLLVLSGVNVRNPPSFDEAPRNHEGSGTQPPLKSPPPLHPHPKGLLSWPRYVEVIPCILSLPLL